jgi:DNA helicase TIP49 (TBP-interacting protein)
MAIFATYGEDKGKQKVDIKIDNGDLEALKEALEQYGFVNEEALLRYALVSLLQSTDNTLYVKRDSNIVAVRIAQSLLKGNEVKEADSKKIE